MTVKSVISPFVPQPIWRWIRLQNILREHNRTAKVWNFLIDKYDQNIENQLLSEIKGSAIINSEKVVWQYWAQGYEEVPELVSLCLKSVDKFCQNCKVIRLSDSNIRDYLDLPDYLYEVSEKFGLTFFADLLRCLLVKVYGGVWLDATVLLTAPLPETYFRQGVFMFQRDSEEKHKEYWENSYAYYFGWSKGFRVNVLNSVLFAQKDNPFINRLCGLMLWFCKKQESLPSYFTFQILFDILSKGEMAPYNCPIISDCIPHYLMQFCNGGFPYASFDEIFKITGIHKLSYKSIDPTSIQQLLRDE